MNLGTSLLTQINELDEKYGIEEYENVEDYTKDLFDDYDNNSDIKKINTLDTYQGDMLVEIQPGNFMYKESNMEYDTIVYSFTVKEKINILNIIDNINENIAKKIKSLQEKLTENEKVKEFILNNK